MQTAAHSHSKTKQQQSASNGGAALGRIGSLTVKIAETDVEIEAALRLRHQIFSAAPQRMQGEGQHDEDRFDAHCDHLIVLDDANKNQPPKLVATYRLLGQEQAGRIGGFYSAAEFDLEALLARHPEKRFLEFGRSCVLPEYRSKRTIELLWHGSWAYVRRNGFDVMFGCASFAGTDPSIHRLGLSFLGQNAMAEPKWQASGIGEIVPLLENPAKAATPADLKSGLKSLPPLIKGYLRLGAMFAGEAVVDRSFGTIDVLVLLPLERLNPRYVKYYGEDAERHAR